jgi:ABC-2 type transport system ATP-binding protein
VDDHGERPALEANMTTLAIDASGLRKSYGDKVAVESLDMQVAAGTVVGFLGPNGAGKTTVIRMLSTLLAPDSGSFAVASVSSSNPVEIRRKIGVLPESAGYPPAQTSEEWLVYHAELFGSSRTAARDTARSLLAEVGLADRSGSRIANLSRGMRQRLGIARALVNDPAVVFLDEPTLGLDPRGQQQVLDLVARIAREHKATVVLSTHTLAEVEQVCSRVLILNRGRLVADGTVADVVRSAAAPRSGVLVVPADARERALGVLAAQGIPATAQESRPGEIQLTLPVDSTIEQASTAALASLLAADVQVLGLTLEGGRLSDAFLAVTESAGDD